MVVLEYFIIITMIIFAIFVTRFCLFMQTEFCADSVEGETSQIFTLAQILRSRSCSHHTLFFPFAESSDDLSVHILQIVPLRS